AAWQIIVLSVFLGVGGAFDAPVRLSFVVDMVEKKEDLGNAIALNSTMFNVARLIGPSLAGIIVAVFGEGICFLLNGISFLAVIVALMLMEIKHKKKPFETSHVFRHLKEGLHYAFGEPAIKYIILLISFFSLLGASYIVVMPVVAKEILHGGVKTLGFLMASAGLGALIGALYLAWQKTSLGFEKTISIAAIIFGAALAIFSFSRVFWISMLLILCAGFGMMVQMAASNTVIQTVTEDDKRGRVMSLYTMAFMGLAPFGSLLAGSLAGKIGAALTLLINGILCILGALLFSSKIGLIKKTLEAKAV
ncbi:MAG: MFS transporter, partial [Candidatus Omnitrophica bacterium]|nr:MFS transporter [Candidatus Omnitrophota bacterium]